MALAGILSIFQAWLIPGFLFLLFFRNIKILDNLVLSIPLSLVINYILISNSVNPPSKLIKNSTLMFSIGTPYCSEKYVLYVTN